MFSSCFLLIFLWAGMVAADATSSSTLIVSRNAAPTRTVRFDFTRATVQNPTSTVGTFISGQTVLGTVMTTVTASLKPDTNVTGWWLGSATETLTIPRSVLQRAEEKGISRFQYQRQFTGVVGTASVQIVVTTSTGGPLQIKGMRLYFDNNQGDVTVKCDSKNLTAFTDIDYDGTGQFRAHWKVDGRILSYVNRYLNTGGKITLKTPEIPGLPTFREGSHTVRLIIQEPDQPIHFPRAIYYVSADKVPPLVPISLADPGRKAVREFAPLQVSWNTAPGVDTYLVEFFLKEEDMPIFSAYVDKSLEYTLPETALRHYFVPGRDYAWQVKGFDGESNLAGESGLRKFRLH